MVNKLRCELEVIPAYDNRKEGKGQHCAEMRFYVHGPKGSVQFVLYTGWYLEGLDKSPVYYKHKMDEPMPVPMYEDQSNCGYCKILDSDSCYYDGSTLNADKPFRILVSKGSEALWKYLKDYYKQVFNNETK